MLAETSSLLEKIEPLKKLNAVCPYYTMFPLEFPYRELLKAKRGEWVLDPFCGRGTTNFAARLLQLPSVGLDSNPVAVAIAAAKFVYVKPNQIIEECSRILSNKKKSRHVPTGEFWKLCYHPKTLLEICKIREELLRDCSTPERIALRAIMMGVLHGPLQMTTSSYLSNQMPRTYATKPRAAVNYWRKHKMKPSYKNVEEVVAKRARLIFSALPPKTKGGIVLADSRHISVRNLRNKFRWIITSPPYLGMNTYVADQWLRNWFLGGMADVDYGRQDQVGFESRERFAAELASVWRTVSKMCVPNAKLIIRFGALPSFSQDPAGLLKHSLQLSQSGWQIIKIRRAGDSSSGHRQAPQFSKKTARPIGEIDVYAILKK